jgi:histone arginine demethylase JMJD6
LSIDNLPDNIDRIDINRVSNEEFIQKYEKTYTPVIIQNAQENWLAKEKWTLDVI